MRLPFSSLRARLNLLILITVIPAWGLILYNAAEQRRLAIADIQKDLMRFAELTAREEEQVLQSTRQVLFAVSSFLRLRGGDPAADRGFLSDLRHHLLFPGFPIKSCKPASFLRLRVFCFL